MMKLSKRNAPIAVALLCIIGLGAVLQTNVIQAAYTPTVSVRVVSQYTASNALIALQVSGAYFPSSTYVSLYFDVEDDFHKLGTVKTTSSGTFAFSFDVMEGYTGTHTVIAKYNGAPYTATFNILNTRPMDQRLVNLLDWIYGNLTEQISIFEARFLPNGSFYVFVDNWFTWIYGNLTLMNTTINQINATVNQINGTVNIINTTVGQINSTVNHIDGVVVLINGTVVQINGTVNIINDTVTLINGTVTSINTTVNQISVTVSDIWDEVQLIEEKLDNNYIDVNGSFYESAMYLFDLIFGNLTAINSTIDSIGAGATGTGYGHIIITDLPHTQTLLESPGELYEIVLTMRYEVTGLPGGGYAGLQFLVGNSSGVAGTDYWWAYMNEGDPSGCTYIASTDTTNLYVYANTDETVEVWYSYTYTYK